MIALALLLAAAEVPAWLSAPAPGELLRWPTLVLEDEQTGRRSRAATLAAGRPLRFEAKGPALVRLFGPFTDRCEPKVTRRAVAGDGTLDLPLPLRKPAATERLLWASPAVAPGIGDEESDAPATYRVELDAGCPSIELRAVHAVGQPDEYGLAGIAVDARRRAVGPLADADAARWLGTTHPHRWQETMALAAALPTLLARVPGEDAGVGLLTRAWIEEALREARAEDLEQAFVDPIALPGATLRPADSPQPLYRLADGADVELDVSAATSLRLFVRAPMEPAQVLALVRADVRFDDRPIVPWISAASHDPTQPTLSRQRSLSLPIPPGAQRARIHLHAGLWMRGLLVRHKVHVEDAWAVASPGQWLARAAASAGQDARTRLVVALARAQLGDGAMLRQLATRLDRVPGALAAIIAAEASGDLEIAAALLREVPARVARAEGELELRAVGILGARAARVRATLALREGKTAEAVTTLLELASRQAITDEDALSMAEADAMAPEGLAAGAPVLAAIDGLLSLRPFDHHLLVARARAFALATASHGLSPEPGLREVTFLEPPPGPPRPRAADRAFYRRLQEGGPGVEVVLPAAPLPGRRPVLSLIVLRRGALGRAVVITVDGKPLSVAALDPFERVDLPLTAGAHRVALAGGGFAGEVYVSYAAGAEHLRLRRYTELQPGGAEWRSRELGNPSLVTLSVRLSAPAGASPAGETELELHGAGPRPVRLRLRPGQFRTDPRAELAPGTVVTEPLEVMLPAPATTALRVVARAPAQVRVLVSLGVRRHRAAAESATDPAAVLTSDAPAADAETSLQSVTRLTAQLAGGEPAVARAIARAAALLELDEVGLAREDLLAALATPSLGPHQRAAVRAIWRSLDEAGSTHPASVAGDLATLSPALLLIDGQKEPVSLGLLSLLDEPDTLARAPAATLRKKAGDGAAADLAVLHAARMAEASGDVARAAELWLDLARAHPAVGLLRREAGRALLLGKDPRSAALAYLELTAAAERLPRDPLTHRLLRQASGRTRLRRLKFVDRSAGARAVQLRGGEPLDPSVEAALLPPMPNPEQSMLLSATRQASLAFSLNTAVTLKLRARVAELRPNEAQALGSPPISLEWSRDGEPPVPLGCDALGTCTSAPIVLPAGAHGLQVRATGGVRPAGRLWIDAERTAPGAAPLPRRLAAAHVSDHLVARTGEPLVVVVHGPALWRVEARPQAGARALSAEVTAETDAAPPLSRRVELGARTDENASLEDGTPLTPAIVTTLPLPLAADYRVRVRPSAGEVLLRLAVRDGEKAPPERLLPTFVHPSLVAPPAVRPETLQEVVAMRAVDGDVAPALEQLGALTTGARWSHLAYAPEGVPVQTANALSLGLAYRRLLDSGFLTLKLSGDVRVRDEGSPAEWLSAEAFFRHPELRALRVQLALDGFSQPIGDRRYYTGVLRTMLEPVLTVTSGLHLVSKLGVRLASVGPGTEVDGRIAEVDPDVYSRYRASHARALFLEEGLETEPFANLVLYGNARLTSNASLSPFDQDHVSATVLARALFGRIYTEVSFRTVWFFVDADRPDANTHAILGASVFHSLWTSARQRFELGASGAYHFDNGAPELSLFIAWEGSNGRRFRDHTPLEGEDYFFPQRGPGPEPARLEAMR